MAGPEDCLAHFLNLVQRIGETCETIPTWRGCRGLRHDVPEGTAQQARRAKGKASAAALRAILNFRDMSQDLDSRRAPT